MIPDVNLRHEIIDEPDQKPENKQEKVTLVIQSDAIIDPRTVMIHQKDARVTRRTVMRSHRLDVIALRALFIPKLA